MAIVEQQAEYHNESISQALDRLCSYLPVGDYNTACKTIVDVLGPLIIDL